MKTLWGVRHVRYFLLRRRVRHWYAVYEGPGAATNPLDRVCFDAFLDAVWEGRE